MVLARYLMAVAGCGFRARVGTRVKPGSNNSDKNFIVIEMLANHPTQDFLSRIIISTILADFSDYSCSNGFPNGVSCSFVHTNY
jgi:hypothetical protein